MAAIQTVEIAAVSYRDSKIVYSLPKLSFTLLYTSLLLFNLFVLF